MELSGPVTVLFEAGRFHGLNVCNSFGGEYSIEGSTITISETMSTAVGCADERLSDEVDEVLRGTATFTVDAGRMTLEGEPGEPTFVFIELPPDDAVDQTALAGTWDVYPATGEGPPAATHFVRRRRPLRGCSRLCRARWTLGDRPRSDHRS